MILSKIRPHSFMRKSNILDMNNIRLLKDIDFNTLYKNMYLENSKFENTLIKNNNNNKKSNYIKNNLYKDREKHIREIQDKELYDIDIDNRSKIDKIKNKSNYDIFLL